MSSIVNKIKDAIHSDSSKTTSHPEGTSGPHSSRAANAADPRIDSDRDHRGATTTSAHDGTFTSSDNYTTTRSGGPTGSGLTGTHGTTGTTGTGFGSSGHSTNAGPHSSNLANKVDPRVDSDRDGNRVAGNNTSNYSSSTTGTSGLTGSHGTHATHGTTGSGLTGSHGTHGTTGAYGSSNQSTNAGPHDSNIANKLDPRVDSDRDGNRVAGNNTSNYSSTTGTTGPGLTGSHGTHGTTGSGLTGSHGTHGTTGSGLTGSHGTHGTTGSGLTGSHGTHGTTGSGLTGSHGTTGTSGYSTNAGPHDSNFANKLDPRVDSDRDGNRLAGNNNTTYGSTGTHGSSGLTGTHGTHGSSGLTGTTGTHGSSGLTGSSGTHGSSGLTGSSGTHGTTGLSSNPGPAPNTAGPHKSDAMNKIDPRVDSDRDGSKTLGADKTYSRP
jgi:hypothetical protein